MSQHVHESAAASLVSRWVATAFLLAYVAIAAGLVWSLKTHKGVRVPLGPYRAIATSADGRTVVEHITFLRAGGGLWERRYWIRNSGTLAWAWSFE